MKQCTKCKQTKPFTDFTKGPDDGYRYQCRQCNLKYQENPEKRKEVSARFYQKRKLKHPALFMWKQAKSRAKWDYDNMEFSISVEDIILTERCPYLNIPFEPLHKRYGYSLDRIDSTKGYVRDNIRVISRLANIMKNNATEQELISFAKGVLVVHSKEEGCDAYTV